LKPQLTNDFRSIVLNKTPLLDVRAPVEFDKGAFAYATNIPIMDDEERRLIGIRYKEEGNAAAIKLGQELIGQSGKERRVALWREYIEQNPDAMLYCFRGGQRSGISQSWLAEAGLNITRLKGGYKAFRNYLLKETELISAKTETLILGGRTGSGKTLLLNKLQNAIDLESIANHRGSTFGNYVSKQPSQIDFENNLAYRLIEFEAKGFKHLVIEHESHNIGRLFMPKPIYTNFMQGKLIILETPLQTRVEITYHEYVTSAIKQHTIAYGDEGLHIWAKAVNTGLDRIKKRLGSEAYLEFKSIFNEAYLSHGSDASKVLYKQWIEKLLSEYYDPMYDYQLQKSPIPVIFKGNFEEVLTFIGEQ
jgi:tRNA 2-selenouridine synthase